VTVELATTGAETSTKQQERCNQVLAHSSYSNAHMVVRLRILGPCYYLLWSLEHLMIVCLLRFDLSFVDVPPDPSC